MRIILVFLIVFSYTIAGTCISPTCAAMIKVNAQKLKSYLTQTKKANDTITKYKEITNTLNLQLDELSSTYTVLQGNNKELYKKNITTLRENLFNVPANSRSYMENVIAMLRAKAKLLVDIDAKVRSQIK